MFTVQESIVAEYQRVLAGQIARIPNSYFTNYSPQQRELHALIVIRYALQRLLKLNAQQALLLFDKDMASKLKVDTLFKYIRFPFGLPKNTCFYVVFSAYPNHFSNKEEKTVLYIYEKAIAKNKRIPNTFFDGEDGKNVAAIALRYQLDFLGLSTAEKYAFFTDSRKVNQFLTECKLKKVIGKCFSNPLEYLHYSLPYNEKSDFWYDYYNFKKVFLDKKKN